MPSPPCWVLPLTSHQFINLGASNMAALARGRGRRTSGPSAPLRRPGEPPKGPKEEEGVSFDSLAKLIKDFSLKSSESLLEEVTAKFIAYCTSDTRLQDVAEHLCQKSLNDMEFAKPAAQIASKLCTLENTGVKFRSLFLKQSQDCYKNRDAIRKKSCEEWMGLVSFICQTFNAVRISDAPLKPLAGAAYQVLTELLTAEGRSDDEVDCFNQQFRAAGKLLQSVDKVSEGITTGYDEMRIPVRTSVDLRWCNE